MLFQMRGCPPGKTILDRTVIFTLCAKAGVVLRDSIGPITSHRGRASAVTALASVPQGLRLPELMAWHSDLKSIKHSIRVRPTQLAGAFANADQMAHMVKAPTDHLAMLNGGPGRRAVGSYGLQPTPIASTPSGAPARTAWPARDARSTSHRLRPRDGGRGAGVRDADAGGGAAQPCRTGGGRRGHGGAVRMLAKLWDVLALDGRTPLYRARTHLCSLQLRLENRQLERPGVGRRVLDGFVGPG